MPIRKPLISGTVTWKKCLKEMRGKKVTRVDDVHGMCSDLWEKIFSNQYHS